MKITQLSSLGIQLNGTQGTKKYDYLTIAKVKEELENKNIFQFLEKELGHDIDTYGLYFREHSAFKSYLRY